MDIKLSQRVLDLYKKVCKSTDDALRLIPFYTEYQGRMIRLYLNPYWKNDKGKFIRYEWECGYQFEDGTVVDFSQMTGADLPLALCKLAEQMERMNLKDKFVQPVVEEPKKQQSETRTSKALVINSPGMRFLYLDDICIAYGAAIMSSIFADIESKVLPENLFVANVDFKMDAAYREYKDMPEEWRKAIEGVKSNK